MIIRETKLMEAWCPHCGAGQMAKILERSFAEKKSLVAYIGETFPCDNCGNYNTVEDVASFMVQEYLVSIASQRSKQKINNDLKKWLHAE